MPRRRNRNSQGQNQGGQNQPRDRQNSGGGQRQRGQQRGQQIPQGQQFYMVWGQGGNAPSYQHQTLDQATAEATRLAAQSNGRRFYVLQALKSIQINQAAIQNLSGSRQRRQGQGQGQDQTQGIQRQLQTIQSLVSELRKATQQTQSQGQLTTV